MKTHGATIWRFGAGLAALAMTTGAIICTPITASASAHGCVDNAVRPSSCIDIDGGGTYVNSVVGSVYLDGGSSVFGRFHIYGGGLEFKTNDAHYYNGGHFGADIEPGPYYFVGRDLPNRAKVCSSFEEKQGAGYKTYSPACKTIKS